MQYTRLLLLLMLFLLLSVVGTKCVCTHYSLPRPTNRKPRRRVRHCERTPASCTAGLCDQTLLGVENVHDLTSHGVQISSCALSNSNRTPPTYTHDVCTVVVVVLIALIEVCGLHSDPFRSRQYNRQALATNDVTMLSRYHDPREALKSSHERLFVIRKRCDTQ